MEFTLLILAMIYLIFSLFAISNGIFDAIHGNLTLMVGYIFFPLYFIAFYITKIFQVRL